MRIIQEVSVQKENATDEYAIILKIYKNDGCRVSAGDSIVDIEMSKCVISYSAEVEGYIKLFCKEGEELPVGSLIFRIYDENKENPEDSVRTTDNYIPEQQNVNFSKNAEDFLNRNPHINRNDFNNFDYVSLKDIQDIFAQNNQALKAEELKENQCVKPNQPETLADSKVNVKEADASKVEIEKISVWKRAEINNLTAVQSAGMNSNITVSVNTEHVSRFIQKHQSYLKESILPIAAYEASRLLRKYRVLNSYFTNNCIALYKDIHLVFAFDFEDGLKVLKIPNTDQCNLQDIEYKLFDLFNKFLDKKATIDDMSDTTFTISDLSYYHVDFFTPLITKNQACTLGISSIDHKLNRCNLTLNFDHRVTTGKLVSNFLYELKNRIESYNTIIENQDIIVSSKFINKLRTKFESLNHIKK